MIFISRIVAVEVQEGRGEFQNIVVSDPRAGFTEITREMIQGHFYKVPGGGHVCIGISEQARGALGITLEAIENEREELEEEAWNSRLWALLAENNAESRYQNIFNNMSTLDRIKHVFKDWEKRLERFWG